MDLEPELNSCGDMPKDMITNLRSKWLRNSQGLLSDGGVPGEPFARLREILVLFYLKAKDRKIESENICLLFFP